MPSPHGVGGWMRGKWQVVRARTTMKGKGVGSVVLGRQMAVLDGMARGDEG